MTLIEAIDLIERVIRKETAKGDSRFALCMDSQLEKDINSYSDDDMMPMYRADILYLYCGYYEPSISAALISLGEELKRVGYK